MDGGINPPRVVYAVLLCFDDVHSFSKDTITISFLIYYASRDIYLLYLFNALCLPMAPTSINIYEVQYIDSGIPDPTGWAQLREHLTSRDVKLHARKRIPHYKSILRALEQIYTPVVEARTPEAVSTAAGLLLQVESLLSLPSIEVAFGQPIRLSEIYLGPLYWPTITCGWKLQKQPGDERVPGCGPIAWGPSVSGVLNPVKAYPRLLLPFLALTIVQECHGGNIRSLLRQSRYYGACMIANMLEVKSTTDLAYPEVPDPVEDNECIRALTLTVTSRRIILVAHWTIKNGDAPPAYLSRIVSGWDADIGQYFPVRDALLSIRLAMEWIFQWNIQRYCQIIRKIYGFYEFTCCACERPRSSLDHDTTCEHMHCADCPIEWQEPNY